MGDQLSALNSRPFYSCSFMSLSKRLFGSLKCPSPSTEKGASTLAAWARWKLNKMPTESPHAYNMEPLLSGTSLSSDPKDIWKLHGQPGCALHIFPFGSFPQLKAEMFELLQSQEMELSRCAQDRSLLMHPRELHWQCIKTKLSLKMSMINNNPESEPGFLP